MKTAFPPMPAWIKEVDWDFELTDEEKEFDKMEFERISSWPEFEEWKKEMMNATFENIPSGEETKTVQIPVSIFDKFKTMMDKANIPFSVL